MIREISNNFWAVEGPWVDFFSFPFPTRMYIAKLNDNNLWIHSPVKLTNEIKNFLQEKGTVKYLISPNHTHNISIKEYLLHYPNAIVYGMEFVKTKLKGIDIKVIQEDKSEVWSNEIKHVILTGSYLINEIIFFHIDSQSLIITDYFQNHDFNLPPYKAMSKLRFSLFKLDGIGYPGGTPKAIRCTIYNTKIFKSRVEKILKWNFERICISHGKEILKNTLIYFF